MTRLRELAVRAVVVAAAAGALAACKKASADYCVDDNACPDVDTHCDVTNRICVSDFAPDAEPVPCDQTHPCPESLPFCDLGAGTCAICGDGGPSACPEELPACVDNHCAGCSLDSECDSEACLDDGSCADESATLYAAPTGTSADPCTKVAPCDLATAVGLLTPGRNVIHLAPGVHPTTAELRPTESATFLGRGATIALTSVDPQAVFNLTGGATRVFTFLYVTITGGVGTAQDAGNGIECSGSTITLNARHVTIGPNDAGGVRATGCNVNLVDAKLAGNRNGLSTSGCTAVVTESIVRDNTVTGIDFTDGNLTLQRSVVVGNTGVNGGISTNSATLLIENNVIAYNGGATSGAGGIRVTNPAGSHVIRYNTIADNVVSGTGADAIACESSASIDASSNIIDEALHDPECSFRYSLFPLAAPGGAMNITGSPMFITTTLQDPLPQGFYRLLGASPARNAAETIANVPDDIDGEARPESGTTPDIGADEVH